MQCIAKNKSGKRCGNVSREGINPATMEPWQTCDVVSHWPYEPAGIQLTPEFGAAGNVTPAEPEPEPSPPPPADDADGLPVFDLAEEPASLPPPPPLVAEPREPRGEHEPPGDERSEEPAGPSLHAPGAAPVAPGDWSPHVALALEGAVSPMLERGGMAPLQRREIDYLSPLYSAVLVRYADKIDPNDPVGAAVLGTALVFGGRIGGKIAARRGGGRPAAAPPPPQSADDPKRGADPAPPIVEDGGWLP